MKYKTYSGIILKRQTHREADEIITFWSWEDGKVRLLVRGVKKSASKLKGAVAPLSWLQLDVIPSDYLPVVYNARILKSFSSLGSDLSVLALVFNIFEMVLRTTPDNQPNPEISSLLRRSFEHLDANAASTDDFLNYFRLHLLQALGSGIMLDACARCGKTLEASGARLSFIAGGTVCQRCVRMVGDMIPIEPETRQYIERISKLGEIPLATGSPSPVAEKASAILIHWLYSFIERRLNSENFLQEIKK